MLKSIGKINLFNLLQNHCSLLSTKSLLPGHGFTNVKKKVGDANVKVTLIAPDDEISIVSFAEADKISKRRELKLVKIIDLDTKTKRPVYKLMTGQQFHEEDFKRRAEKKESRKEPSIKGEKFLPFSSNIGQHDFDAHLRKLTKWLQKFYEVRIVINGDDKTRELTEKIFSDIQGKVTDLGTIKQKQLKGGSIKFQIIPFLKVASDEDSEKLTPNQTELSEKLDEKDNTKVS